MRNSMRLRHALLAAGLFNLVSVRTALSAEAAADAPDALAEITVTAERREETAQKTPVTVNVYGSAEITQKDLVDLQALTETDPNLVFNRNGGEATLAIRGITTNNTTEIGNPAVPVGVDSFFVNRAAALDSTLFDIQRIEVLLGPQGTLFGRSAVGGVVNITTNKPTKDFEAGGSFEYGNYQAINATGAINLPVTDWLQLRIAASSRTHQGYRLNTFDLVGSARR
jgi:iron complex outermembrane receptor protein